MALTSDIFAQMQFAVFGTSKLIVLIVLQPFLIDFALFLSILSGHITIWQQFWPKMYLWTSFMHASKPIDNQEQPTKNHETTLKTNQEQWKTVKLPWKSVKTNQNLLTPWNHFEKSWKPVKVPGKPTENYDKRETKERVYFFWLTHKKRSSFVTYERGQFCVHQH